MIRKTAPRPVFWSAQLLIVLAVPFLLVMTGARLVMTPLFLQIEYTRPGFPFDRFGMSTDDRLQYGPLGIEYILNGEDITFLGDLRLPPELCAPPRADGCPMFNRAELRHMHDVKVVASALFLAAFVVAITAAAVGYWLWRTAKLRLYDAIFQGASVTLGLIGAIILLVFAAWDYFFTLFHSLFFEDGTWQFLFSDTLIRLYPQQFWFDAALTMGTFTTLGALGLLFLTWQMRRRTLALS